MNTFLEIIQWVQSQLSVTGTSTQFTLTRIKAEINFAYIWACSKFNWKKLERAKTTSTIAGAFYYDYPPNFRSESIFRLEIDGKPYDKKDYDDFLEYKRNYPTDTSTRIFANHESFVFVFPTPAANGVNNLDMWGYIIPNSTDARAKLLVADGDKTIFSDSEPEGNLAIAKQALAVLQAKGKDKKTGQIEDAEALGKLASIYNKIVGSRQTEQQLNQPIFDPPDFFGNTSPKTKIGNF